MSDYNCFHKSSQGKIISRPRKNGHWNTAKSFRQNNLVYKSIAIRCLSDHVILAIDDINIISINRRAIAIWCIPLNTNFSIFDRGYHSLWSVWCWCCNDNNWCRPCSPPMNICGSNSEIIWTTSSYLNSCNSVWKSKWIISLIWSPLQIIILYLVSPTVPLKMVT